MSEDEYASDLAIAAVMADAAREAALPHFRSLDGVENKLDDGFDPVTVADKASERAMRAILAEHCPQDGILGEEYGSQTGTSGRSWTLDPIDGTRAFISGVPTWTVLIALCVDETPVAGVIDQPYLGERFLGSPAGTRFEKDGVSQNVATRSGVRLDTAILSTTDPHLFSPAELAAFDAVRAGVRLCRFGYDAYAYAMLAMGQMDMVIESGLQPYDVQALIPVVRGAGGVITDWRGGDASAGGQVVASANQALHDEALERLAPAAT